MWRPGPVVSAGQGAKRYSDALRHLSLAVTSIATESVTSDGFLFCGGSQHPGHQDSERHSQPYEFRLNQRGHAQHLLWIMATTSAP